ncbi:MAG: hypothetical protein JRH11_19455 [Deltaproteobacteria bacterium]|nr:hypothetical protein [Deltaproteobacteria bacterium]
MGVASPETPAHASAMEEATPLRDAESPLADGAHCPRCDKTVPVIRPWGGWPWVRRAWLGVMGVFLLLFPFMAADYVCMIPTLMMVMFAAGPIFHFAGEKPTCRRCRLELARS